MKRIYTHNDLDGVGCGILAKLAFGDEIEIFYNSVSSLDRQIGHFLDTNGIETTVFITDLGVNEENEKRLDEFAKQGGKVYFIDHHKTSLPINSHDWARVIIIDQDGKLTSATSLFYQFLLEKGWIIPRPSLMEFVELIRQYDTWEWEKNQNIKAKRLNELFFLLSIDEFEKRMMERIKRESDHFQFDEFEEKLLKIEEENMERYVRRKKRETVQSLIDEHCVGIVHAESYHSELGNEIGKEHPHLDYIAILNVGGRKISMRTIHDEIDVSAIAQKYNGGGHAKAAGCSMTPEAYERFVAKPFFLEPLRLDALENKYNIKESKYGTLFKNHDEDYFLIYNANNEWMVDKNGYQRKKGFLSFSEAERFLKRNYKAWLVGDSEFIRFLMDEWLERRQSEQRKRELVDEF
jgi:oligoribonuclease NrnB/cAMP/cGMP phosphodiesterase (DHH superfamily)